MNSRNLHCSIGKERLNDQWHHWFIAGSHFWASLSWFIFPLLSPARKFIVKTDYSRIYTGVFPPFCPQSSLCLDFQQETTARADYSQIYTLTVFAYLHWFNIKLFLDASEGLLNSKRSTHKQSSSSQSFWGVQSESEEIFIHSVVNIMHRMMNHILWLLP